jgi:hypothetical protein
MAGEHLSVPPLYAEHVCTLWNYTGTTHMRLLKSSLAALHRYHFALGFIYPESYKTPAVPEFFFFCFLMCACWRGVRHKFNVSLVGKEHQEHHG